MYRLEERKGEKMKKREHEMMNHVYHREFRTGS